MAGTEVVGRIEAGGSYDYGSREGVWVSQHRVIVCSEAHCALNLWVFFVFELLNRNGRRSSTHCLVRPLSDTGWAG